MMKKKYSLNSVFLLISCSIYPQLKNLDIKYIVDIDSVFIPSIIEYMKDEKNQCSTVYEFYFVLDFYSKNKFMLSKQYDDINNFLLESDAYTIVDGKHVFIYNYDKSIFIETGFYKTFVYHDRKNEDNQSVFVLFPESVISAAWYYEYYKNDKVRLVQKMECDARY